MGVKWRVEPANGRKLRKEKGLLVGLKYQDFRLEEAGLGGGNGIFVVGRNSSLGAEGIVERLKGARIRGGRYKSESSGESRIRLFV
jgi:hypothetical protein